MSTPKHTPGTWRISDFDKEWVIARSRGDSLIANCHAPFILQDGETEANARLIAAAPELLRALKWADRELERLGARENDSVLGPNKAVKFIRTTIAKAEGTKSADAASQVPNASN